MITLLTFIQRFGWRRGFEFYRCSRPCERNPRSLNHWSVWYRGRGSRELYHDNPEAGHAYIAFAEMLQATHDKLVAQRKPNQPILDQQNRRLEKQFRRVSAK